jgi:hypothetical protein
MKKIENVQITMQEIWAASRPNIYRNKKKYRRTKKHKNSEE